MTLIYLNWRIVRSTGNFSSASGLWTLTWKKDIDLCKSKSENFEEEKVIENFDHLKYMSLGICLQGSNLVLRHLKLEEELDGFGNSEGVAVVEASRLHLGLHHNLPCRVHASHRSYWAD